MKIFLRTVVISYLFFLSAFYPSASAGADLVLKAVHFGKTSENKEQVFLFLNAFQPPEIFALQRDKPRVVCDLINAQLGDTVGEVIEIGGELIQRIRIGKHASPVPKIRVVVDLVPKESYSIEQRFFQKDNIFALIVCCGGARNNN
ncbi:MAG: AMIN domain-containing protein [Deltaproteobacteria bacterium]|nr:AMIN domain-containing protein [Deltaproteobacteria bacterium]